MCDVLPAVTFMTPISLFRPAIKLMGGKNIHEIYLLKCQCHQDKLLHSTDFIEFMKEDNVLDHKHAKFYKYSKR